MTYNEPGVETALGIDVSVYQGEIDWQKVADAGIDFAIIRVGYRGYGSEGKMMPDKYFTQNIEGAGCGAGVLRLLLLPGPLPWRRLRRRPPTSLSR